MIIPEPFPPSPVPCAGYGNPDAKSGVESVAAYGWFGYTPQVPIGEIAIPGDDSHVQASKAHKLSGRSGRRLQVYRVSRHLCGITVVAILSAITLYSPTPARAQAAQKKVKDQGEYDLFTAVTKE